MKSAENVIRKESVDTVGVVRKKVETVCFLPPMPSFPGNIQQFISKNLVWPAGRKNKNVDGRVIVKFYIDRDGACSQFKVIRSLNPAFDVEAVRVLKLMPKWRVDSMAKGGTWFAVPVRFKKQKSQR